MKKLSVALATFNEEKKLRACLESLNGWVDEIVVVDGGSSDATVQIAKEFHAHVIVTTNPPIFHINKQKAIELCKGEWILQLDADELVSESLKKEILTIIAGKNTPEYAGYYMPRKNFFLNTWMKKGGQYPDYTIRLYKNGKAKFPCVSVHEQVVIDGAIGYLSGDLLHYPYASLSEYLEKADRYSTLSAMELRNSNFARHIDYMLFKPVQIFVLLYIRHLGVVDGLAGLIFAVLSALQYPIALLKYYRHRYGKSFN